MKCVKYLVQGSQVDICKPDLQSNVLQRHEFLGQLDVRAFLPGQIQHNFFRLNSLAEQ